jgi:hypothetical protein
MAHNHIPVFLSALIVVSADMSFGKGHKFTLSVGMQEKTIRQDVYIYIYIYIYIFLCVYKK